MSDSVNKWITPAEGDGWEVWETQKGKPVLSTVVSGKKWPSLPKGAPVYLPVHGLLSRIEDVFRSQPEMELDVLKTNLEVEFPNVDPKHDLAGFEILKKGESVLYMGVALDDVEVAKEWIDSTFDVSARLYAGGDELLVWREQNRWVYALYKGDAVVWMDVLGGENLELQLSSLITLLEPRLMMLGIAHTPSAVLLVPGDQEVDLAACEEAIGLPVSQVSRESLMKPQSNALDLLPFEVRRGRKERKAAGIRLLVVLLVVLMALGGMGYLYMERKNLQEEIAYHQKIITENKPYMDSNKLTLSKWNELAPVVNEDWPLEVYLHCVSGIPKAKMVHLKTVKIDDNGVLFGGISKGHDPASDFWKCFHPPDPHQLHGDLSQRGG